MNFKTIINKIDNAMDQEIQRIMNNNQENNSNENDEIVVDNAQDICLEGSEEECTQSPNYVVDELLFSSDEQNTEETLVEFRNQDPVIKRLDEIQNYLIELTKSHDSLITNLQSTIVESMATIRAAKAPTKRRLKTTKYTEDHENYYKAILEAFTQKTGKNQRDLTNGVNQLVASNHGYSIGKPSECAASEHILTKVAKDNEVNADYLTVDKYLDTVKEYVKFITGISVEPPEDISDSV
jgi:hypothetical protein